MNELELLEIELHKIENSQFEYFPEYGYSSKSEIMKQINEDISLLKSELEASCFDYTEDELENECIQLCISQGLSRKC